MRNVDYLIRRVLPVVILLVPSPAGLSAAHEEGVLKLRSRELATGDSVRVVGEKFGGGTALTVVLVGIDGRRTLAEVTTDTAGTFAVGVRIPTEAAPGQYRMIAVAGDGDEVASLDVTVTVGVDAANDHAESVLDDTGATDPSGEPLVLDRARSSVVTAGVVTWIVSMLLIGVVLLRAPVVR